MCLSERYREEQTWRMRFNMFTEKHFVEVAKSIHLAIKDITTHFHPTEHDAALRALSTIVGTMVSSFEKDNPRFKKDKFLHVVKTGVPEPRSIVPLEPASELNASAILTNTVLMEYDPETERLEFTEPMSGSGGEEDDL